MLNEEKKYSAEELVEQVLKQEPEFLLPDNFAEMLAAKAGRQFVWEQYIHEFLIYLGTVAAVLIVLVVMSLIWFQNEWKNWLDLLIANVWVAGGLCLLAIFILFTDRVLLRYFLYRSHSRSEMF